MKICLIIAILFLFAAPSVLAEVVMAECYEPRGPRVDFQDGEFTESSDGFTGANPTFIFDYAKPDILIESWPAPMVAPEVLSREEIDKISPPTITRSAVIFYEDSIIQAVSTSKTELYTTTLYIDLGIGFFTRVRRSGQDDGFRTPTVGIYTAKCSFNISNS